MTEAPVETEQIGSVLLVTINRPQVMNAIDLEASVLIGEAVERVERTSSLHSLIITGRGADAFCSGGDLGAMARNEPIIDPHRMEWGFAGYTTHFTSKVTIAAVNGAAIGGGLEIMLASDLAIAGENAVFSLPDVKLGWIAGAGGLIRLPAQIPRRVALYMIFTGEGITADEALRFGLVNSVTEDSLVVEKAIELGDRIGRNAPLALEASKRVAYGVLGGVMLPEATLWEVNVRETAAIGGWKDPIEGLAARYERRSPRWSGE